MSLIKWEEMSPTDREHAQKALGAKMPAKQQGRGQSQLEIAFSEHLQKAKDAFLITEWTRAIRAFDLAGNTTYLPDYVVLENDLQQWRIEVKGPYEFDDGSRIKIKVAAEKYPEYRWLWVVRKDGRWIGKEVTDEGISRKHIRLDWL